MYEICLVVRAAHVDTAFVDSMAVITPLNGLGMLQGMKTELHLYLAAAQGALVFDTSSVNESYDFTRLSKHCITDSIPGWKETKEANLAWHGFQVPRQG